MAEAGTGKSRLCYEFKATLPAECKIDRSLLGVRVPGRTVQFYTLRAGVPRPPLWRKTLRAAVFSDDLREPGMSEKSADENTMPAAHSSGAPNTLKPLEISHVCVGILPLACKIARFCPVPLISERAVPQPHILSPAT